MATELDGFAVLRTIGSHADIFAGVAVEARKLARALVVKQLKAKTAGIKSARDIRRALGDVAFALLTDAMTDTEIKAVLGKLDKHHPEFKTANPQWRRQHLRSLADGSAEPAVKPKAPPKAKAAKKAKTKAEEPELLGSLAMAAVRKR